MRSSKEDALALLTKWKEEGRWMVVLALFEPKERHEFWAKVENVSADALTFAGRRAVVRLALDESLAFEYSDEREVPAPMRDVLKGMECSLAMVSQRVRVVLAVARAGDEGPL